MAQTTQAREVSGNARKGANKGHRNHSPLADLPARTTAQVAHAPAQNDKPTVQVTGQWLFDTFITGQQETTRLDMVKLFATKVDVESVKKAFDDMVALAADKDKAAGFDFKAKNPGPLYKSAQARRTELRLIYGAMRFASDKLPKNADTMGYSPYVVAARKALETKGIKWDGIAGKTKEQRDNDVKAREDRSLFDKAAKENPHANHPGLTTADWMVQIIAPRVDELREELHNQQLSDLIQTTAQSVIDKVGTDIAEQVAKLITKILKDAAKAEAKAMQDAEQGEPQIA